MSKVNVNDFSDRSDSDMGDAARRQGWNSSAFSTTRTEEYTTGPYKSIINPAFSAGEDAIRDFLQQERGSQSNAADLAPSQDNTMNFTQVPTATMLFSRANDIHQASVRDEASSDEGRMHNTSMQLPTASMLFNRGNEAQQRSSPMPISPPRQEYETRRPSQSQAPGPYIAPSNLGTPPPEEHPQQEAMDASMGRLKVRRISSALREHNTQHSSPALVQYAQQEESPLRSSLSAAGQTVDTGLTLPTQTAKPTQELLGSPPTSERKDQGQYLVADLTAPLMATQSSANDAPSLMNTVTYEDILEAGGGRTRFRVSAPRDEKEGYPVPGKMGGRVFSKTAPGYNLPQSGALSRRSQHPSRLTPQRANSSADMPQQEDPTAKAYSRTVPAASLPLYEEGCFDEVSQHAAQRPGRHVHTQPVEAETEVDDFVVPEARGKAGAKAYSRTAPAPDAPPAYMNRAPDDRPAKSPGRARFQEADFPVSNTPVPQSRNKAKAYSRSVPASALPLYEERDQDEAPLDPPGRTRHRPRILATDDDDDEEYEGTAMPATGGPATRFFSRPAPATLPTLGHRERESPGDQPLDAPGRTRFRPANPALEDDEDDDDDEVAEMPLSAGKAKTKPFSKTAAVTFSPVKQTEGGGRPFPIQRHADTAPVSGQIASESTHLRRDKRATDDSTRNGRQQAVEQLKAILQADPVLTRKHPQEALSAANALLTRSFREGDETLYYTAQAMLTQTSTDTAIHPSLNRLAEAHDEDIIPAHPQTKSTHGSKYSASKSVNFKAPAGVKFKETAKESVKGSFAERVHYRDIESQEGGEEDDPLRDFRPSDSGSRGKLDSGQREQVSGVQEDTRVTMPSTMLQRSLASQKYSEGSLYPEHPTARRSERLKATRKTLGRTLRAHSLKKVLPELPSKSTVYTARDFREENDEAGIKTPAVIHPDSLLGYHLLRIVQVNWLGQFLFYFYLAAFGYYTYVRTTQTLNLKPAYLWYGIVTFIVECLGAVSVFVYGLNHLWDARFNPVQEDPLNPGLPLVKLPYVIRVLVVCYKEDIDIVVATIEAANLAILPAGCHRCIYLCDDGRDPEKAQYMASKGEGHVYVAGRVRPAGELNGKSGNLNNVLNQLYGTNPVPGNEILCILDADMALLSDFFLRTVPLLDEGDDVSMVLTPQAFHNLDLDTDIFNHSNVHFWQYMQPGADAIGFISCTGTNFLLRARCLSQVGWFPTYTMTEDYALGLELKKEGYQCRYVRDYLALGEAPHQIRNAMQQRSRWAKGHFQIVYSKEHCPLLQKRLSWSMRLLYCSAVYSYIICCVATPFFQLIPVITIWLGIFPLIISGDLAIALTLLGIATNCLLYRVRTFRHVKALFFANLSNQLMWYAYLKAAWRGLTTTLLGRWFGKMAFKSTAKGKSQLEASPLRDVWIHVVTFIILVATIICGIVQLADAPTAVSPVLISICWAAYGCVPSALVIFYTLSPMGDAFQLVCRLLTSFYTILAVACITLVWVVRYVGGSERTGGRVGLLYNYIPPVSEARG